MLHNPVPTAHRRAGHHAPVPGGRPARALVGAGPFRLRLRRLAGRGQRHDRRRTRTPALPTPSPSLSGACGEELREDSATDEIAVRTGISSDAVENQVSDHARAARPPPPRHLLTNSRALAAGVVSPRSRSRGDGGGGSRHDLHRLVRVFYDTKWREAPGMCLSREFVLGALSISHGFTNAALGPPCKELLLLALQRISREVVTAESPEEPERRLLSESRRFGFHSRAL